MNYKVLVLLIFILSSCGPASKLRRAEKLIAKAEQRGAVWHSDTLMQVVEIPVPEVKTDTVFESVEGDTVTITKDRLEIKYVNLPGEKIYLAGKCKSDTVYKETEKIITKTIHAPKKESVIKWWWLLITGLAGAGLIALLKK
jgi:hypothetical protein